MFKEKIKKAIAYVFGYKENLSLENRLFLSAIIFGILICLIGSIISYIISPSIKTVIICILLIGLLSPVYYFIRFKGIVEPFKIPLIIITLSGISVIWVFDGGMYGSDMIIALVILMLTLIGVSNQNKKYVLFLFISLVFIIYLIQLYRPDYIINITSETNRWLDSLITVTYSSIFIFLIIRFIHRNYNIERLRAEESEIQFRLVFKNSNDAILWIDAITNELIRCNNAAQKMFERDEQELIGQVQAILYPKDKIQHLKERIQPDINGGTKRTESEIITKSGKIKTVEISATIIKIGDRKVIQEVFTDISERKKTEQALKESEAKFRTFVNNVGEGFGFVNPKEEFVFANPAAEIIFGVGKDELPGKSLKEFLSDREYTMVIDQTKIRKEGKSSIFENEIIRPDGEKRNILVTAVPQFDENQNFIGTYSIFRDITERKQAESKIQQQNQELTKLNADKDRFMSILAHDLKSPFTSLVGFSTLLLKNLNKYDVNKIEKQLTQIKKLSLQSYNLLEDLLLWSKSQSGKLPFEPQEIHVQEICNEIIINLSHQADSKKITINLNESENLILWADINMFKTILRNLISNAIKFTHQNGKIDIYTKNNHQGATVTISDNGIGIDQENLKKLWDITIPHNTVGTAGERGTGLGLILCKEFVEKHKGKIWVESQIGKGSNFCFTLPSNSL
jgi:PAS domain S-box-containing protein